MSTLQGNVEHGFTKYTVDFTGRDDHADFYYVYNALFTKQLLNYTRNTFFIRSDLIDDMPDLPSNATTISGDVEYKILKYAWNKYDKGSDKQTENVTQARATARANEVKNITKKKKVVDTSQRENKTVKTTPSKRVSGRKNAKAGSPKIYVNPESRKVSKSKSKVPNVQKTRSNEAKKVVKVFTKEALNDQGVLVNKKTADGDQVVKLLAMMNAKVNAMSEKIGELERGMNYKDNLIDAMNERIEMLEKNNQYLRKEIDARDERDQESSLKLNAIEKSVDDKIEVLAKDVAGVRIVTRNNFVSINKNHKYATNEDTAFYTNCDFNNITEISKCDLSLYRSLESIGGESDFKGEISNQGTEDEENVLWNEDASESEEEEMSEEYEDENSEDESEFVTDRNLEKAISTEGNVDVLHGLQKALEIEGFESGDVAGLMDTLTKEGFVVGGSEKT
jgi:arsenate reductase-like glutaredoxin family protein